MILAVCPVARIGRDRLLGDRWLIRTKTIETVFNKTARQFRHWNLLSFGLVIEGIDQITTKPRRVVSLHKNAPVPDGGIATSVLRIYCIRRVTIPVLAERIKGTVTRQRQSTVPIQRELG